MEPTAEQRDAIEIHDRALLVEAGAGTGKTAVLVNRFVYLLDQHQDWPIEGLVAVTFTEKAAREMRGRIRQAVEERARGAAADSHWHTRRRELDRLQVGTIHSLCARILRENAIAARVDPHFTVLDEQDADLLKAEAVRRSLAALVQEDSPALALLASLRVTDVQNQLLVLLSQRGTMGRLFKKLDLPEVLLETWRAGIAELAHELWQEQLAREPLLTQALAELPGVPIIDPDDKLAPAVQAAQAGCAALAQGDYAAGVAAIVSIRLQGGKDANWGGKESKAELVAMLKALRQAGQALQQAGVAGVGPGDVDAAQHLQHWRELWQRTMAEYDGLKGEALDFDDLEMQAEALLAQAPRDERVQAFVDGVHHLMVDEFQDTNERQRRIVYALAPPEDGGRLFVVGDAKQSIYRFRQAQVSVFNSAGADIQRATGHPALRLSTSFRSHGRLVAALNDTFDRIMAPQAVAYAGYEAQPGPLTAYRGGSPDHPAAPEPVELILLPRETTDGEKVDAETGRLWEARLLAERLQALQAGGFPVWDRDQGAWRPFQFGDAAVLFRATTSLPLYEEVFKDVGLPYLTVSGRGYYDRPEVQDLLALLAALYNPRDDLSLATALRSPLFALSDETLYRLRRRTAGDEPAAEPLPYVRALASPPPTGQPDAVAHAARALAELWSMVGRVEVWQLLREAIDRTAYEGTMALLDREGTGHGRRHSNVLKLQEMARARGGANLSEFLRRVQDLQAREAREGEAPGAAADRGAVQLMSVHAAKGLEWPVVAVADLGRGKRLGGTSPYLRGDPAFGLVCKYRNADGDWEEPAAYQWASFTDARMEEAESRRLLYVACTRAADLLILSGRSGGQSSWLSDLLAAWEVEVAGEERETVALGHGAVAIWRPAQMPAGLEVAPAPRPPALELTTLPDLARPLGIRWRAPDRAVVRLARALAGEAGGLPQVPPAVRHHAGPGAQGRRAPEHVVGTMVHRVLAAWEPLRQGGPELAERLRTEARRAGLLAPAAVDDAVGRGLGMLEALRRTPLFAEIDGAPRRLSEVPFGLDTPQGHLHGVIDLLYVGESTFGASWHLVDWKTERVPRKELEQRARRHLPQLAAYAMAVGQRLGTVPAATLCFLAAGPGMVRFAPTDLEDAWQRLLAEDAPELGAG